MNFDEDHQEKVQLPYSLLINLLIYYFIMNYS